MHKTVNNIRLLKTVGISNVILSEVEVSHKSKTKIFEEG